MREPMRYTMRMMRATARYTISLLLFAGGVWTFTLRIPVWSLLLGVPAIQVGIMLLIVSFDQAAERTAGLKQYHIVSCEVCGNPTAAPIGETHEKCPDCRAKTR